MQPECCSWALFASGFVPLDYRSTFTKLRIISIMPTRCVNDGCLTSITVKIDPVLSDYVAMYVSYCIGTRSQ